MRALRIIVRNPMSLLGLILVGIVVLSALLAPWIAPYPDHNGAVVDFLNNNRAPSLKNLMGTDLVGRDILSRIMYGYQISLVLGVIVLAIATPIGTVFGLIAGYRGGWVEIVLMRIVDIFLSIPPLVLAIAMMGVLEPTLTNAMLAVTLMWWPWYARLVYSIARGEREVNGVHGGRAPAARAALLVACDQAEGPGVVGEIGAQVCAHAPAPP